ncbi:MAG TPA: N-6 DNA methylase, partial [Polyangiaceae bacterium]|nr:N-6 DNA methylase [Polyangiaceae bacterium]
MTAPRPNGILCDPACGTAGFLVCAGEHLPKNHPDVLRDAKLKRHFHEKAFHDFDNTMLRIGSMNMLLHGVENPDTRYQDFLAQDHASDEESCTLVLANHRSPGRSIATTPPRICYIVKSKKTELLFWGLVHPPAETRRPRSSFQTAYCSVQATPTRPGVYGPPDPEAPHAVRV